MTVAAVSMVKDEADIIEATVRNMANHVDFMLIADNGSTDGTREILEELSGELPLTVQDDPEPAYLQAFKMSRLASIVGREGADWIVPFDADEWWYATNSRIKETLDKVQDGYMTVQAKLYDHISTGIDDKSEINPVKRMKHRRKYSLPLPKVACRYRDDLSIWQGNHQCDYGGIVPMALPEILVVRHFPYRSPEQFISKVRNGSEAYKAAGERLSQDTGAHWRQWGNILDKSGESAVVEIYHKWFFKSDPNRIHFIDGEVVAKLVYDPIA